MILFRYILRSHIAPFFFSVFTLISIFLLQFLMKFADKLVGKGLSFWVITKLIVFNLAWMLVLVVPMSVLVATLMAFGGMAQNNEVAIMKASGVSLYKMSLPPLIFSAIIALMLVYFNNNIYPDANHAAATLIKDINRTKPTFALEPGVFSQEMDGYSILTKEKKGDTLINVTIYDYSKGNVNDLVTAKKGRIYFSGDQRKLILDLQNGEIHEFDRAEKEKYRIIKFTNHIMRLNADQFAFSQSSPGGQRGFREMGAATLMRGRDSLRTYVLNLEKQFKSSVEFNFLYPFPLNAFTPIGGNSTAEVKFLHYKDRINNARSVINSNFDRMAGYNEQINTFSVEIHKKYSLPIACIIFVLIGAPLGTMTRRGGFGVAAGISLTFFLIYWACLIGGEKLAIRGYLSPFLAMWSANFIMGAFGLFILYKSAKEKIELNFDWMKKLLPKQLRIFQEQNENN